MAGLNVNTNTLKIPINNVSEYNQKFTNLFVNDLNKLINKGNYILGDDVLIFEQKFAKYVGTNYCLGLNSGTSALELSFQSLNLTQNDEIIIQANAYIACAFGALKANAKLKIIDCELNGLFNVNELIANITENTKAVLVVHLYGDCCNMEQLQNICKNKNIILIEDCAQSLGSKYNGKMIGSYGDISCHSFYPSKNLGALGDGGAICTNNIDYYEKIRHLRNLGSTKKYEHNYKGTNSRLDTLHALFLLTKFDDIDNMIEYKRKMVKLYNESTHFSHIINSDINTYHSYHLYVVKLNENINRNHFQNYLLENGIESIIHYKIPFYKTDAFSEFNYLTFVNTEKLANTILSLPIFNTITENQINHINDIISKYIPN